MNTYVTPNSPRGGLKSEFVVLVNIIQVPLTTKSATNFLCVKTSSGKIVVEPLPI